MRPNWEVSGVAGGYVGIHTMMMGAVRDRCVMSCVGRFPIRFNDVQTRGVYACMRVESRVHMRVYDGV